MFSSSLTIIIRILRLLCLEDMCCLLVFGTISSLYNLSGYFLLFIISSMGLLSSSWGETSFVRVAKRHEDHLECRWENVCLDFFWESFYAGDDKMIPHSNIWKEFIWGKGQAENWMDLFVNEIFKFALKQKLLASIQPLFVYNFKNCVLKLSSMIIRITNLNLSSSFSGQNYKR